MEALNDIFSNIQAIHQLHRDFLLPKLEARMKEWYKINVFGFFVTVRLLIEAQSSFKIK